MTINFSKTVTLWQADKIPTLDIYFQPGLTWTSQGTQGVALLFLENHAESADLTKQDFREFTKGLVRWVVAAHENSTESELITQAKAQTLYDDFTIASLDYSDLRTFLSNNFRFNIQECKGAMEGTVFPMFPSLELIVGDNQDNQAVKFAPDEKQLDAEKIAILQNFYGQLKIFFGAGHGSAEPIVATSVTEFLFVGYVRLLIRTTLQSIIDALKAGRLPGDIDALLNLPNATYRNIAQMASRFLLNGFNLPENLLGWNNPRDAEEGLYASTNQQYTLSDSLVTPNTSSQSTSNTSSQSTSNTSSAYKVTLQMGGQAEDFLSFPENPHDKKARITYTVTDSPSSTDPFLVLAKALNSLNAQSPETLKNQLHSAQPKPIFPYRKEHLHFALRNRVLWPQNDGSTTYLLPLPKALLDHLEQRRTNPVVDLQVWVGGDPNQPRNVPNRDFTWATRIDLTLQRVASPRGNGFLKQIYEIGSSSESDHDLLEVVLEFLYPNPGRNASPIKISLLRTTAGSSTENPIVNTVPGNQDNILLLRANLSTETTGSPSSIFSAEFSNQKNFLGLLWAALDMDTGGFYLYIPHDDDNLDSAVFKDDISAVFSLLIEFTDPNDPIYDFNNCAVFKEEINVEQDLVLARSSETIPVQVIPPGYLGFQNYDRPDSSSGKDSIQSNGLNELKILYQLLGWQVAAIAPFRGSNPGLPVSPTQIKYHLQVVAAEDEVPDTGMNLVVLKGDGASYKPYFFNQAGEKITINQMFKPTGNINQKLKAWSQTITKQEQEELLQVIIPGLKNVPEWLYERLLPVEPLLNFVELKLLPESEGFPKRGIANKILIAVKKVGARYDVRIFDPNNNEDFTDVNQNSFVDSLVDKLNQIFEEIDNDNLEVLKRELIEKILLSTKGFPPYNRNPYLGISNNSELKIKTWWQDIYGNQLLASQAENTFPIRYTDALIGINQWPSVSENYSFTVIQEPNGTSKRILELSFSFDPSPYSPQSHASAQDPARSRKNRIEGDKITIEKVYYQLFQSDVQFTVSTSLDDDWTATVNKAVLMTFVKAIYRYLSQVFDEPTSSLPSSISEAIDADGIVAKSEFIFPVEVKMTMSRNPELVSEDFKEKDDQIKAEYENVWQATAILAPKFGDISTAAQDLSLRPFAQDFQVAFPGLLLAVSEDQQNRTRSGIAQQPLYAVRLGTDGITYDIQEGQPVYYALPPLANVLLSGEVAIDNYESWQASSNPTAYNPTTELKRFDAVDLNILARNFLVAVENFLEPAVLVPAFQAEPVRVGRILQQKAKLAAALSKQLDTILKKDKQDVPEKLKEAREAIRQELLVDLVKGYDIETVVQYGVSISVSNAITRAIEATGSQKKPWASNFQPPRIRGKAQIKKARVGDDLANRQAIDLQSLDFKLSSGSIQLRKDTGTSYFTYLFDTKAPEQFANLELDLDFVPTEIEYDIQALPTKVLQPIVGDRQASNFLNFVLPEGLGQSMGSASIPIPLREYPASPSLIFQQAEPDPTSRTELADVRQWQYTIVYEHLNIAQDSIDCILQLNVPPTENLPTESGTIAQPGALFGALVNFNEIYPKIAAGLATKTAQNTFENPDQARKTILALESLIQNIATKWENWTIEPRIYAPSESDLHFLISEEPLGNNQRQGLVTIRKTVSSKLAGAPAIQPSLALPGFVEKGSDYGLSVISLSNANELPIDRRSQIIVAKIADSYHVWIFNEEGRQILDPVDNVFSPDPTLSRDLENILNQSSIDETTKNNLIKRITLTLGFVEFLFEPDPNDLTFFGDSSIPDRKFMVENLDVIEHHNAWASVWLSRNQDLVIDPRDGTSAINPAFIFQTPAVRFNTMVTPFITNDEPWNIATLGSDAKTPQQRTLEDHLNQMINTLFPRFDGNQYEVRLSCRYGFALSTGRGLNEDLVTTLPILLGLQITPTELADGYATDLKDEIGSWLQKHQPSTDMASLIFTVDLFSTLDEEANSSLPTLRITHLGLSLEHISDLQELMEKEAVKVT